ncbi:hypothetical protein [Brevibacillus agri]|uniref:hypothetical protein n=1 Tax=Brevibacillus agri TaxID=51101 RepID=UPI0018CCF0C0|nr:hypothetical protein [Brevibacillus agri]MBG9568484.1 hypothetical protein [Brevibacillus agri]
MARFAKSKFVDVYDAGSMPFQLSDTETVEAIKEFILKYQNEFDQECFAEADPYCVGGKPDVHDVDSRAVIYSQGRLIEAWDGEIDEARYFLFRYDGDDYRVHKGFYEIVLESSKHWLIDLINDHYDDFDCFSIVECPVCGKWSIAV